MATSLRHHVLGDDDEHLPPSHLKSDSEKDDGRVQQRLLKQNEKDVNPEESLTTSTATRATLAGTRNTTMTTPSPSKSRHSQKHSSHRRIAYRSTLLDASDLSIEQAQALMGLGMGLMGPVVGEGAVESPLPSSAPDASLEAAQGDGRFRHHGRRWGSFVRSRRWTKVAAGTSPSPLPSSDPQPQSDNKNNISEQTKSREQSRDQQADNGGGAVISSENAAAVKSRSSPVVAPAESSSQPSSYSSQHQQQVHTKTIHLRSSTTYGLIPSPFVLPFVDLTVTLPAERVVWFVPRQPGRRLENGGGRDRRMTKLDDAKSKLKPKAKSGSEDTTMTDTAEDEEEGEEEEDAGLYTDDQDEDDDDFHAKPLQQSAGGDDDDDDNNSIFEWEIAGWEDRMLWDGWLERQAEKGTLVGWTHQSLIRPSTTFLLLSLASAIVLLQHCSRAFKQGGLRAVFVVLVVATWQALGSVFTRAGQIIIRGGASRIGFGSARSATAHARNATPVSSMTLERSSKDSANAPDEIASSTSSPTATATTTNPSSTRQTPTPPPQRRRDFAAALSNISTEGSGRTHSEHRHHRAPSFASSTTSTTADGASLRSMRRLSKGFQPKSPAPTAATTGTYTKTQEDNGDVLPKPIFIAGSSASTHGNATEALGEAIAHGTRGGDGDVFSSKQLQNNKTGQRSSAGKGGSKLRKEVKKTKAPDSMPS